MEMGQHKKGVGVEEGQYVVKSEKGEFKKPGEAHAAWDKKAIVILVLYPNILTGELRIL